MEKNWLIEPDIDKRVDSENIMMVVQQQTTLRVSYECRVKKLQPASRSKCAVETLNTVDSAYHAFLESTLSTLLPSHLATSSCYWPFAPRIVKEISMSFFDIDNRRSVFIFTPDNLWRTQLSPAFERLPYALTTTLLSLHMS